MKIIPVINCQDFEQVKERMRVAQELLLQVPAADRWVHIDIADGSFTKAYTTWRNASELAEMKIRLDTKIELHLMVNEPEQAMDAWLAAGISRLIFHLETTDSIEVITAACNNLGIEPMLAIMPDTPVNHVMQYCTNMPGFQFLAVKPGPAGQPIDEKTFERIGTLRERFPHMTIEVDGGINPETARRLKQWGATQAVSGSYIFGSGNPAKAFKELLDA